MSKRKIEKKKEKLRRHSRKQESDVAANPAMPVSTAKTAKSMTAVQSASVSVSGNPLLNDASDLWKQLYAGISRQVE